LSEINDDDDDDDDHDGGGDDKKSVYSHLFFTKISGTHISWIFTIIALTLNALLFHDSRSSVQSWKFTLCAIHQVSKSSAILTVMTYP